MPLVYMHTTKSSPALSLTSMAILCGRPQWRLAVVPHLALSTSLLRLPIHNQKRLRNLLACVVEAGWPC